MVTALKEQKEAGRHGADAQNGAAVSRARPQPRAQPVGGTAPAGRQKRAVSRVPTVEAESSGKILRASDFGNAFRSTNLKLFVFIVRSLVDMDRIINVMDLMYGSRYSRRVQVDFLLFWWCAMFLIQDSGGNEGGNAVLTNFLM